MNLNSISVTHHMIAGLWKIPEQYCLCCPILEYAIFTVFQTDKRLCQECNPVFSPIIILSDNATGLVFTLYISCMKYSLSYKLRYPLTADAAIPAINCFWKNRYISKTGMIDIAVAAKVRHNLLNTVR